MESIPNPHDCQCALGFIAGFADAALHISPQASEPFVSREEGIGVNECAYNLRQEYRIGSLRFEQVRSVQSTFFVLNIFVGSA